MNKWHKAFEMTREIMFRVWLLLWILTIFVFIVGCVSVIAEAPTLTHWMYEIKTLEEYTIGKQID